jgi:hypothetical protein
MADNIKRIDIKEFRELGFLQELNRQFLHPLGMAMEIVVEDDGTERLGGIWDSREDPEGFVFAGFTPEQIAESQAKADKVLAAQTAGHERRNRILGFALQPVDDFGRTVDR